MEKCSHTFTPMRFVQTVNTETEIKKTQEAKTERGQVNFFERVQ